MISSTDLQVLEDTLLNKSGSVPLHTRFRVLFTLKSLKNEDAARIISAGPRSNLYVKWQVLKHYNRAAGLIGSVKA